jgi:hypothetical protein
MTKTFNDYTITVFESHDANDTIVFSVWEKIHSQWKIVYDIHYNNGGWTLWSGIISQYVDKDEALELHKFTREWCKEIIGKRVASY